MQSLEMPKELSRQVEQVAQMLAELDAPVEEKPKPAPQEDWDWDLPDETFIGSLIELKPDPRNYTL